MRDYEQWHHQYDDPDSGLSHRLAAVRRIVSDALDERTGPVRLVSACAGDGRDVLEVLAGRPDRDRVTATLIEILPVLADRARSRAADSGLTGVDVRTADAGRAEAYLGAVPADIVLLVGIFGNVSAADIENTARVAPRLCAPGATLVWSRGLRDVELNERIRGWFADAGFTELDYLTLPSPDGVPRTLGVARYDGAPQALAPGSRLFTFTR